MQLRKRILFFLGLILCITLAAMPVSAKQFMVPGISNPYLAGMPNGATAKNDTAPEESPVLVTGIPLAPGRKLTFSASGLVSNDPSFALNSPDGGGFQDTGPENGFPSTVAPVNSLLGVFLDNSQPNLTPTPDGIDFYSPLGPSQNYISLSPLLKQVFFIGDGRTSGGQVQQVVVPSGATRLYLGTMDGCCWNNNVGSFTVYVDIEGSAPALPLLLLE
jgi:hypothetical protein